MTEKRAKLSSCLIAFTMSFGLVVCLWQTHAGAMPVTVDTVDRDGAHVDGWVDIGGWRATPFVVDVADGAWVGGAISYGYSSAHGGTTVWAGNTYSVDPATGTTTYQATSGSTLLNFVLTPMDVYVSMVDHAGNAISGGAVSFCVQDQYLPAQELPVTILAADGWWLQAYAYRGYSWSWGRGTVEGRVINEWDLPDNFGTRAGDGSTELRFVVEPLDVYVSMVDHAGNAISGGAVSFCVQDQYLPAQDLPVTILAAHGWWLQAYAYYDDSWMWGRAQIQGGMINEWIVPDVYRVRPGTGTTELRFVVGPPFQYQWLGFLPPLTIEDKAFKQKSTVPIKLRISDLNGNPVPDCLATLALYYLENSTPGVEAEVVSTAAGDWGNQFRYDPADDLYIFNLSTKPEGYRPGWTYEIVVTLDDGQEFTTTFALK